MFLYNHHAPSEFMVKYYYLRGESMGLLKKIFGKFHSQNNVEDAVITKQANISSQQDDVHGYEQVTLKEMVKRLTQVKMVSTHMK